MSRDQLMDRVWGYRDYAGGRVVDSHVARIRRKLGEDGNEPRFIRTVHGVGYAFQEDRRERAARSSGCPRSGRSSAPRSSSPSRVTIFMSLRPDRLRAAELAAGLRGDRRARDGAQGGRRRGQRPHPAGTMIVRRSADGDLTIEGANLGVLPPVFDDGVPHWGVVGSERLRVAARTRDGGVGHGR